MNTTEIEQKVTGLLAEFDITYVAQYRGVSLDRNIMDEWFCTFYFGNDRRVFQFFTDIGLRTEPRHGLPRRGYVRRNTIAWEENQKAMKPTKPHPAGVLSSLIWQAAAADMSFYEWCSEYDYDDDSRKAEAAYLACRDNAYKLREVFSRAQLEALDKALQGY